jgi:hypothetical protein
MQVAILLCRLFCCCGSIACSKKTTLFSSFSVVVEKSDKCGMSTSLNRLDLSYAMQRKCTLCTCVGTEAMPRSRSNALLQDS